MRIIDNFISNDEQLRIRELLTSDFFPWYFHESNITSYGCKTFRDEKSTDNIQLSHLFIHEGNIKTDKEVYSVIIPLIKKIEEELLTGYKIIRMKANLLSPSNEPEKYNVPHVDIHKEKHKSVIYYVNDSDGDTIIFSDKVKNNINVYDVDVKVSPKQGRILLFDSHKLHTSSCPKNSKYRVIINIMYSGEI